MAEHLVGVHAVEEWLVADPARIEALLVEPGASPRTMKLIDLARRAGIPVRTVPSPAMAKIAGPRNSQGVAAEVKPFPYLTSEGLERIVAAVATPLILAVDGVTDPQNLGAILRSAAFFGVDAVVLPQDRSAPISPVVERTAAGGVARVPIHQAGSFVNCIDQLKATGLRCVVSVVGGSRPVDQGAMRGPSVLVVGSEGQGVRPSVRKLADDRVMLPAGKLESLNVATFTGIFLYEAVRQRGLGSEGTAEQEATNSP